MTPTRRTLADTLAELDRRFAVVEEDDELAIAIRVVGAGPGAQRDNLLTYVRDARLVRPLPAGNRAHRRRLLPSHERARIEALRGLLRKHLAFTGQAATDPALSEGLAAALVLAARCREALGLAGPWALRRAQDGAGGSRYELGLGADAEAPTPAEVRRLFEAVGDPRRPPAADPDVEAVLGGTEPVAPGEDRDGAWLLHACGLRTVHRTARN
jgi:hypothetical protein